ncbi:serine/threonine-protein kinase [Kitasatospora sp. NPDC050543]|uniref:serine/threonine-protein kinase n=1 Tax=Kitasatospora sp. NPDC050543 TaxID=3364054 RepID=UPI0037936B77
MDAEAGAGRAANGDAEGDATGATGGARGAGGAGGADADGAGAWSLPGYTHGRELGRGASGRVVLAQHDETGTAVAIKYLNRAEGGTGLRAEAEVLGGLRSPHVTRLYEYVESSRGCAIVMEVVDGVALRTLLREEGATTPCAALVVLKGSLLGLAAAHEAGIVHRDYKPGNVLVASDGTSKLVDFGIAVRSGDDRDISGTPAYLAPEQWAGKPASPAADVYAATVTFFECLTGARPYDGATIAELAVQHTEAPIPDELAPAEVRPLIRAGLAKTPTVRPGSAAAFVSELEAVATAGYGEDWEERGRADLVSLVALLAFLLPGAAAGPASGTTALAHTSLGPSGTTGRLIRLRRPGRLRAGRRAQIVAGVAASSLAVAALAGVAIAGASEGGARTVLGAAPEATTVLRPTTPAPGSPSDGPGTVEPSASTGSASPSASPSAGATGTATGTAQPSPTKPGTGAPTGGTGKPSPFATGASVPPAPTATLGVPPTPSTPATPPVTSSPTAGATTSPSATVAPASVRVASVNIDSLTCYGRYGLTASVTVVTEGTGPASLTFTWSHNMGTRTARITVATDTVALHDGRATVTLPHTFGSGDTYPDWGVQVGTSPAALKPQTTYRELFAPTCDPPR